MKICTLLLLICAAACAATLGDRAPAIPSAYVTGHPRLGAPDSSFLNLIWNGGTMIARYRDAADDWDSSMPGTLVDCRRLLIAYQAEKLNSGMEEATYLQKIKDLSTTTDMMGAWAGGICAALAYDWTYDDLDGTSRSNYRTELYAYMTAFEGAFAGSSPYNDQFYITGSNQTPHLLLALAVYPDDAATSLPHLRWSMDVWFNMLIPTWRQVIGGGCTEASDDEDINCGGAWHEGWGDYLVRSNGLGLPGWYVMTLLAWQNASGDEIFTREGWLKNFAYWMMYAIRPDFTPERLGAQSLPYFVAEYTGPAATPGALDGLAAIYDDPTLRGWSRLVNWGDAAPDGYEPSAWPYYAPDNSGKMANDRSSLSLVRDFPGIGAIFFRSGWGEDDTLCTLKYGAHYWSHPMMDAGSFLCFNRGALAIKSGSYRPGSNSPHFKLYAMQAIAHNVPLVFDPDDAYAAEEFEVRLNDGMDDDVPLPNDGGQRRVGSEYNVNGTAALGFSTPYQSPANPPQWLRSNEYYQQGRLVAFAVTDDFSSAAVDMTAAYNNIYSHRAYNAGATMNAYGAGSQNRSYRVQKATRQVLFIPRGTAGYFFVYDQITSTDATFLKQNIIHFINEPTVVSNTWEVTRTQNVDAVPYPDLWPQKWAGQLTHDASTTYQYDGKQYGWMVLPAAGTITKVGGAGSEFLIGATNYKECGYYGGDQCTAAIGTGAVTGEIAGVPGEAPIEAGSWRIEMEVGADNLSDTFAFLMLNTYDGDTNVVSEDPSVISSGNNWVFEWKDNSDTCTYTYTVPKVGIGGDLTKVGAGCI